MQANISSPLQKIFRHRRFFAELSRFLLQKIAFYESSHSFQAYYQR